MRVLASSKCSRYIFSAFFSFCFVPLRESLFIIDTVGMVIALLINHSHPDHLGRLFRSLSH